MSQTSQRFYGKFRGKVTDNRDPLMLGRIRAQVPAVFGDEDTGWALPCAPYAGSGVGFFFIPPVGANVWMEFENGKSDYPIWVGGFWGPGEAPKLPALPYMKVIKTDSATITINDLPGLNGITIETVTGLKIALDITGIELKNSAASIKLTPASVSINNGALDVI
jgi:Type VI secretion system/phage-baseplate injector OB domain